MALNNAGSVEIIQFLMDKGSHDISRGLHPASCFGNEETLKHLISLGGADVNLKNSANFTPILCAVQKGHSGTFKLLLENGADLGAKDGAGKTALHLASESGHLAIVECLLEKIKDGDDQLLFEPDAVGNTAIDLATTAEVVLLLQQHGATPTSVTEFFWRICKESMTESFCKFFIENFPVDVNMVDEDGRTPLHHAVLNANHVTFYELLSSGADVHAKDKAGKTALHVISDNIRDLRLTEKYLTNAYYTNNLPDKDSWTIATKIIGFEFETLPSEVVMSRCSGITNFRGLTSAQLMSIQLENTCYHAVNFMQMEGADVESRDNQGRTPLHYAAANGCFTLVRYLIMCEDANVEAKDNDGLTPGQHAILNFHFDIEDLLLSKDKLKRDFEEAIKQANEQYELAHAQDEA